MYRGIQIPYSSNSIGVVELFLVSWNIIRNPRVFTESVLDHQHLDIRKSNAMTHKIISINRLRIAVTFLQGTFQPKALDSYLLRGFPVRQGKGWVRRPVTSNDQRSEQISPFVVAIF